MLSTIALFVVVGSGHMHFVSTYKDVATCNLVVEALKRDELTNPVEPLIGSSLRCIKVSYSPPEEGTPKQEPIQEPSKKSNSVPACVSRKVLGAEVACGKVA